MMRVLFLTHRLPYAPNRGDRVRAFHTLRALAAVADVDLVSLVHDDVEASHVQELSVLADVHVAPVYRIRHRIRAAAASLLSAAPLTHALLDSQAIRPILARIVASRPPDVVLAYCSGMARFALEPPLAGLPLVIDLVDVDSLKWRQLASRTSGPMRWIYSREATVLGRFEAAAARRAFATAVVNERERAALAEVVQDARIEVVPSGVDAETLRSPTAPSASRDVVFCGVMNYRPNEEAAVWLAREVWPLVRATYGDATLRLVGSNPTHKIRALSSPQAGIDVTGHVADVRPYLWNAAVAAAPLFVARGIQNKVLEAVAAGLPAVVTPIVAEGLPDDVLSACRVAGTAEAFAGAIIDCLALSPPARRAMTAAVDLSPLCWNRRLMPLVDLVIASAAVRSSPASTSPT
jgi:polysaccharide biosynthesis protein PslH